ncbi:MAG TPA: cytochrome P450, partial [Thermoanaerobaculia bacterium]|nr:cytochrome P450 [Thermoanaerobaculia bacterium]
MTTLPPGRDGLPLLGETLDFAKNPFAFIESRLKTHGGRIFRSNVLGRKTAVIAGADAAGRFIDPAAVMREGSMPPHVQELFGGRSLPLLDGDVHAGRKREVLKAFSREALASYLPVIESITADYFANWANAQEIGWNDELKKLS